MRFRAIYAHAPYLGGGAIAQTLLTAAHRFGQRLHGFASLPDLR
jgi:hypothetical protein